MTDALLLVLRDEMPLHLPFCCLGTNRQRPFHARRPRVRSLQTTTHPQTLLRATPFFQTLLGFPVFKPVLARTIDLETGSPNRSAFFANNSKKYCCPIFCVGKLRLSPLPCVPPSPARGCAAECLGQENHSFRSRFGRRLYRIRRDVNAPTPARGLSSHMCRSAFFQERAFFVIKNLQRLHLTIRYTCCIRPIHCRRDLQGHAYFFLLCPRVGYVCVYV
jgi:hypothetical protein